MVELVLQMWPTRAGYYLRTRCDWIRGIRKVPMYVHVEMTWRRQLFVAAFLLVPLLASAQGVDDWKKQIAEASKKAVEEANARTASDLAEIYQNLADRMQAIFQPLQGTVQAQGVPVTLTLEAEQARDGYRRPTTNRYQRHERAVYRELGMDRTPYTCAVIDGDLTGVDVEHIVALSEAHDSGLAPAQMLAFSGDPLNLTVAAPRENRNVKSDKDAGGYLPPRNSCWFAGRVLDVKSRWGLTVDAVEAVALIGALDGCDARSLQSPSC